LGCGLLAPNIIRVRARSGGGSREPFWQPIPGPYAEAGNFFEHAIPEIELSNTSFYRLRQP
jgi:hypothetical protein